MKFYLFFIILFISFQSYSQVSLKPVFDEEGVFITKEDFINNKITKLGKFDATESVYTDKVYFIDESGKKIKYNLKQLNYFGLRDNQGQIYMRENMVLYKIVIAGAITMLANPDAQVNRDYDGNLISTVSGDFWYTQGLTNIRKGFKVMLAKDKEVYDAFLADKRKEDAKTIFYILMYNAKHRDDF